MVHITCDLCGKPLTTDGDPRYVVKIAAFPGSDPNQITEEDLDEDHMESLSQLIQRDEHLSQEDLDAQGYKGFRFDLCQGCHRKFLKDPLGKEMIRSLDFSDFSKN